MKFRSLMVATAFIAVVVSPSAAWANDSALMWGGSPRPLNGHQSVSMKSEMIRIEVGEQDTRVDCRFVFENHGPTCRVRMGFPDQGRGAGDPDEDGRRKPVKGTFTAFDSWVGGTKVKTSIERAAHQGNFWHVKTVDFPGYKTLEIRDRYTVGISSSVGYRTPFSTHSTNYILHTGSSWHGNIGESIVEITFHQGVQAPIALHKIRTGGADTDPNYATDKSDDRHAVYYSGPSKPTASGKTLRFVRANWKPGPSDDIEVVFDMHQIKVEK